MRWRANLSGGRHMAWRLGAAPLVSIQQHVGLLKRAVHFDKAAVWCLHAGRSSGEHGYSGSVLSGAASVKHSLPGCSSLDTGRLVGPWRRFSLVGVNVANRRGQGQAGTVLNWTHRQRP